MVEILCRQGVRNIDSLVIHTNIGPILHQLLGGSIIITLLLMVGLLLVILPPTYPPKKIILEETGIMGGFGHLIMRAQNSPRLYLRV